MLGVRHMRDSYEYQNSEFHIMCTDLDFEGQDQTTKEGTVRIHMMYRKIRREKKPATTIAPDLLCKGDST
jgi:hypothetical protein